MKKIIVLSDLWGKEKADWLHNYTDELAQYFTVKFYDSCDLADVDKANYTQENLHKQFVNGGIEKAVRKLTLLEQKPDIIIGFSIGGLIAWKYAIEKNVESVYCISSTRLRKEVEKPNGNIVTFFGSEDTNIPSKKWFDQIDLQPIIFNKERHELYRNNKIIQKIVGPILKKELTR